MRAMSKADLQQFLEHTPEFLERVRGGETVTIVEGERAVADLVPRLVDDGGSPATDVRTIEEVMDDLVASGKARRGTGTLPADFLTKPLPSLEFSLVADILEDRKADR